MFILALGLLAACSSGDDEAPDSNGEAAEASGGDASPSPTIAATSTSAVTPIATATPITTATAVAWPYENYHYLLTIELSMSESSRGDTVPLLLGTVEGDYLAPDAHAFTSTF